MLPNEGTWGPRFWRPDNRAVTGHRHGLLAPVRSTGNSVPLTPAALSLGQNCAVVSGLYSASNTGLPAAVNTLSGPIVPYWLACSSMSPCAYGSRVETNDWSPVSDRSLANHARPSECM